MKALLSSPPMAQEPPPSPVPSPPMGERGRQQPTAAAYGLMAR